MSDDRIWVPVEVIWDEDRWAEDPWRGDPRGRAARPVATAQARAAYGWQQGWSEDDDLPEEEWDIEKHLRQDGAGLSRRKRKKLRGQDRGQGR